MRENLRGRLCRAVAAAPFQSAKKRTRSLLQACLALLTVLLVLPAGKLHAAGQSKGDSSEVEGAQAESLLQQGKLDEAIATLNRLLQNGPTAPGLEAKLGRAYYLKRDFQRAVPHFEAALRQRSDDIESAQLLGLSFGSLGRWQQATEHLERVSQQLPAGHLDTSYWLGVCYLKTQQWDKSRSAFARMFAVPPEGPKVQLLLAQMMVRQHLREQAILEIRKALSADAPLPLAHFLLGEIYLAKSEPQVAIEELKAELQINPGLWQAYWRLGDAYARLERWHEAEKALKQTIWLNEGFTGPYVLLGQMGLKTGDLELGRGFLERAVKMDPNNHFAHYYLGKVYQKLGDYESASRELAVTETLRANQHK